MTHLSGCIYHTIAIIDQVYLGNENTWMHQDGIIDSQIQERYLRSTFVSSCILVTSLIYIPKTFLETIWVIIAILFNTGIFGYAINYVGQLINDMEQKDKINKKELAIINIYMNDKNVCKETKLKIRNYLEYLHQEETQNGQEKNPIIEKLSFKLKKELQSEIAMNYLQKFDILNNNFDQNFLISVLELFNENKYGDGEIIIDDQINILNRENVKYLYLLEKGEVEILYKGKQIKVFKTGTIFGQLEFFSNQNYNYQVRSIGFSTFITISRDEFYKKLQQFQVKDQRQLEIFQMLGEKSKFKEQYQVFGQKCFICGDTYHEFTKCKKVFYFHEPRKDFLYSDYHKKMKAIQIQRSDNPKEKRPQFTSFNAVSSIYLNQQKILEFQENKMNLILEYWSDNNLSEEDQDEEEYIDLEQYQNQSNIDFQKKSLLNQNEISFNEDNQENQFNRQSHQFENKQFFQQNQNNQLLQVRKCRHSSIKDKKNPQYKLNDHKKSLLQSISKLKQSQQRISSIIQFQEEYFLENRRNSQKKKSQKQKFQIIDSKQFSQDSLNQIKQNQNNKQKIKKQNIKHNLIEIPDDNEEQISSINKSIEDEPNNLLLFMINDQNKEQHETIQNPIIKKQKSLHQNLNNNNSLKSNQFEESNTSLYLQQRISKNTRKSTLQQFDYQKNYQIEINFSKTLNQFQNENEIDKLPNNILKFLKPELEIYDKLQDFKGFFPNYNHKAVIIRLNKFIYRQQQTQAQQIKKDAPKTSLTKYSYKQLSAQSSNYIMKKNNEEKQLSQQNDQMSLSEIK